MKKLILLTLTLGLTFPEAHLFAGSAGSWMSRQAQQYDSSPSLLEAARKENVEEVKKLLQEGADPNQADRYGDTPLIVAARNGHLAVVQELVQAGADINQADRYHGNTPLIEAASEGHLAVVQELLQAGADKNQADRYGDTLLILAARRVHVAVVQELLRVGANPNKADRFGNTPLMWAVIGGLVVVQELLRVGANPNKANRFGNTPLIRASQEGQVTVVRELLRAGTNINKADNQGKTAFDVAQTPEIRQLIEEAQKKRAEIAQMKPIVFQQIKVIGKQQKEISDLKARALKEQDKAEEQKIQQQLIAKEKGLEFELGQFKKFMVDPDPIKKFMVDPDPNIRVTMNITDADGNTPLHKAVLINNPALVRWIIQHYPGLAQRKNKARHTPIELAAGKSEIINLLFMAKQ